MNSKGDLGPIIRINPFELHINNPEYYHEIYNFDRHLEKRDYNIQNVQHTGPYPQHRPLGRALDPYLSRSTIQSLEPLVEHNIEALCRHLSAARTSHQHITLSHLYRCMTADIITAYTLGKSYDLLAEGNEKKGESFLEAFQFTFRLLWLLREIPGLGVVVRWLGKMVGRWCIGVGIVPTLLRWQWVSIFSIVLLFNAAQGFFESEIDTHLQSLRSSKHPSDTAAAASVKAVIPSYIYNPSLPPSLRSAQPLHDTTIMLLAAGFETTGFALTTATYHLLSPSSVHHLSLLLTELHTAIPDSQCTLPWTELEKLPYLTAVVKESLRLSLGASARLPRVNHYEDIYYKEWRIPKGTAVGMTHADLHYDERVFPDAKAFKPERWWEGSEAEMKMRERYLVPFSRGGRRCMGI
ncbi:MAG: hypothetical protein Q9213_002235 [Squamulea squamosa]